jgi:hypothetical protein
MAQWQQQAKGARSHRQGTELLPTTRQRGTEECECLRHGGGPFV